MDQYKWDRETVTVDTCILTELKTDCLSLCSCSFVMAVSSPPELAQTLVDLPAAAGTARQRLGDIA